MLRNEIFRKQPMSYVGDSTHKTCLINSHLEHLFREKLGNYPCAISCMMYVCHVTGCSFFLGGGGAN